MLNNDNNNASSDDDDDDDDNDDINYASLNTNETDDVDDDASTYAYYEYELEDGVTSSFTAAGHLESVMKGITISSDDDDDDDNDDDECDPEAATMAWLFEICHGVEPLFFGDELKLLLQKIPNTVLVQSPADGTYPLHVACWNHAPYHVTFAICMAWPRIGASAW